MKKSILSSLLILSLVAFSGCFGGGDEEATTDETETAIEIQPSEVLYEGGDFSLIVNKDWEIIETDSFTSNVPLETIVGFRNNLKNEVFTANLNIAKFEVQEGINSRDLGKSTIAKAKQSLLAFQELKSENYVLKNGNLEIETIISDYEGKKSASEPIINFRQLYIVKESVAYILTAGYLPGEAESTLTLLDKMLKSFRLN